MAELKADWHGLQKWEKVVLSLLLAALAAVIVIIVWAVVGFFSTRSNNDDAAAKDKQPTLAQLQDEIKAMDVRLSDIEKKASSEASESAQKAEQNAKNHAERLFGKAAAMDTSMAESLSKRFKGQLAAVAKSIKVTAAAVDSARAEAGAAQRRADEAFNLGMAALDSAQSAKAVGEKALAKAEEVGAEQADLRQILREISQEALNAKEPLLFGKKGAVHRAATIAVKALGGEEGLAETAAEPPTTSDEQEVMRPLGLSETLADTTATTE